MVNEYDRGNEHDNYRDSDQEITDPWAVLGIDEGASESQIRAAYLRQVKAHPPEREPDAFERIRDAYELLRDPRRRAAYMLLAVDPRAPLISLLDQADITRNFVGPELWLQALKEA